MKFTRPSKSQLKLLPLKRLRKAYVASHETAYAVFEPYDGEIRIAFVKREDKGDFKALMDRLVEELGHSRVRFVATGVNPLDEVVAEFEPSDSQTIHEAVNGFDVEMTEEYENSRGETEEIETLVGDWET